MLSYQHGYHAGNFADVFKHVVQTRLIDYLTRKDKPLLYLDTHAGKGRYDLQDKQALKTSEAKHGVELIWKARPELPQVFEHYIHCLEQLNEINTLRYYPGSPNIAANMLRAQDRLFLCERHPSEFLSLKQMPAHASRIFLNEGDGIHALQSQLPPIERRGLIMIDPSYEIKTEYRQIPNALKSAYKRFSTGTFCLWYPIVDNKLHEQILRELKLINAPDTLCAEFYLSNTIQPGMRGCGLWIINPPYTLKDEMDVILKTLCTLFNPNGASYITR